MPLMLFGPCNAPRASFFAVVGIIPRAMRRVTENTNAANGVYLAAVALADIAPAKLAAVILARRACCVK